MPADPTGWATKWAGGSGLGVVALVLSLGEADSAIHPAAWSLTVCACLCKRLGFGVQPFSEQTSSYLCPSAWSGVPFARVSAAACGCHAPQPDAASCMHTG